MFIILSNIVIKLSLFCYKDNKIQSFLMDEWYHIDILTTSLRKQKINYQYSPVCLKDLGYLIQAENEHHYLYLLKDSDLAKKKPPLLTY